MSRYLPLRQAHHSAFNAVNKGARMVAQVAIIDAVSPDANTVSSNKPSEIVENLLWRVENTGVTATAAQKVPVITPAKRSKAFSAIIISMKCVALKPTARISASSRRRSRTLRKRTAAKPIVPEIKSKTA